MLVKIWGARGSVPAPLTPAAVQEKIIEAILGMPDIDVRDEEAVVNYVQSLPPLLRGTAGGNTTCIEIRSGDDIFIIDAGSGIRELGERLMEGPCGRGEGRLHIFFTHLHWDHIQGFPFFRPAYVAGNKITIYGVHDIQAGLSGQQQKPYFPVPFNYLGADIEFVRLKEHETITINGVNIRPLANAHPGVAYSYRFDKGHCSFVHASDAEFSRLDAESVRPYVDFFRNADVLIFDAQFTLRDAWQKPDWGHSSALIGVDLARAAGVKRLVLFHHDPTYTDRQLREIRETALVYQEQDNSLPTCEVLIGHEGMEIDLSTLNNLDVQVAQDGAMTIVNAMRVFNRSGVARLEQELAMWEQARSPAGSIINLSAVETLTLAGLKALVNLRQRRPDVPMVLVAPNEKVRNMVQLSGWEDYFAVYPGVPEAQSAIRAREALNLPGHILLNRYLIESQLGQTRAGVVLKALDKHTGETVALKIFDPAVNQAALDRLQQSTRHLIGINHPHIGAVLRWEQDGVFRFVVEEFAQGITLREALRTAGGALPLDQVWTIMRDVLRALEYAHSWGIVHANLSPDCIIIGPAGTKVVDFGLGLLEGERQLMQAPPLVLQPTYTAPEQIAGQPPDARTDLYTLGVIAYEMIAGRPPFTGPEEEILAAHLHRTPEPVAYYNPEVTPTVAHMVHRLLARNPNRRYASAEKALQVGRSLTAAGDEHRLNRVLVGREAEVETLLNCWNQASSGQGQLVFISGEPGIGKSSLARAMAARSEAQVVLVARCREGEPAAYYIFAELLRTYLATAPAELFDPELQPLLACFSPWVPDIHRLIPDLPTPPPLEPEQEQLRLMTSLAELMRQATSRRPWLLVLDDLQWIDSSSLELLRYVARHLKQMSLLLVGTYRDTEVDATHPLQESLLSLSSHPGYHHLHLTRLEQEVVGRLLVDLFRTPVPPDLVEMIYQHTEGNPFYVEELASELMESGLVRRENGQLHYPSLEQLQLPPSVHEAVWRRISHLGSEIQALLHQAAVLGQTFRYDHLVAMSGLPERQVLEYLDVVLERQLVREVSSEPVLTFRHAEIQRVLYADLGALRRRILHRQAGEVLEKWAGRPQRLAPDLARHFAEAGEWEKAVHYSLLAAQQARAAYANRQAISWYMRALEILDEDNSPATSTAKANGRRFSAHKGLAEVLAVTGRFDESLNHADAAWSLFAGQTALDLDPHELADLCSVMAEVYERRNDYATAFVWLERAQEYLDQGEPTAALVRVHTLTGWVLMRNGRYQAAEGRLEQALELARMLDLPTLEASSLRHLGIAAWYQEEYARANDYWEQTLRIYERTDDLLGKGVVLNNLGMMASDTGHYEQAHRYLQEALEIVRETGHRWREGQVLNNLGNTFKQLGHYGQAQAYLEEALEICNGLGDRQCASMIKDNLAYLFCELGDYEKAQVLSEQALRLAHEVNDRRRMGSALTAAGHAAQRLSGPVEAVAFYERALAVRADMGQPLLLLEARAGMARAFRLLGQFSAAIEQVDAILDYADKQWELSGIRNPVWIYLACYRVLAEAHDPRADKVLQQGHHLLEMLAGRIRDERLRRSFMENIGAHRKLRHWMMGGEEDEGEEEE